MELQVMRVLLKSLDQAADGREPTYELVNSIVSEARRLVAADDARQAQIADLRAHAIASGALDPAQDGAETAPTARSLPRSAGMGHGPADLSQRTGFTPEVLAADRHAFPHEWEGEGA
jgi:hypothetical protein